MPVLLHRPKRWKKPKFVIPYKLRANPWKSKFRSNNKSQRESLIYLLDLNAIKSRKKKYSSWKKIWRSKKKKKKLEKEKKQQMAEISFNFFNKMKNPKYLFEEPKLTWITQQFSCGLLRGGNKSQIEKKLYDISKWSLKKKKKCFIKKVKLKELYNISDSDFQSSWRLKDQTNYSYNKAFFFSLFEKLKEFRPRLELTKKKRKKGRTSAIAKERLLRTQTNRYLIPNSMSRQKQLKTGLSWILSYIKTCGLRKPAAEKVVVKDPTKKINPKNPIKGKKNLVMAVKAAKKKRLLDKLKIKEKVRFQIYPFKRQIKKILILVFNKQEENSFLANKLQIYVNLLGKQADLNLRRWK